MTWVQSPLGMMALLAVASLVPFAVLMLTSFSKIVVVLSLARTGLGTQQAPPSIVLTGLAAILTGHIMAPVAFEMFERARGAWSDRPAVWIESSRQVLEPLRGFLLKHAAEEERVKFAEYARELRPPQEASLVQEDDAFVIIPAFVVTELKEAFQLGFLIFLPFLLLDMVVANVLLALGMQTLSPTQVSLAFKVLLFVAVDGWSLLSRGLVLGYR